MLRRPHHVASALHKDAGNSRAAFGRGGTVDSTGFGSGGCQGNARLYFAFSSCSLMKLTECGQEIVALPLLMSVAPLPFR
jgi:hypothetical protein